MIKEDRLQNRFGRETGMKNPEGYFDDFTQKIMQELPAYQEDQRPQILTKWQRIKPYVYLATMFAGIWCMMKIFHIACQSAQQANLDAVPESVVLALQNSDAGEYYEYWAEYESGDFEIETEVSQQYTDIAQFEKDFGYHLSPEYKNMVAS